MSVGGTERDRGRPRTASEPHVEGVARRVAVVGRCGAVGAADHRPEAELGRLQHVLVADFGRGRGDVVAVAVVVVGRVLQAVSVADHEHADVRHPRPVHQEPVLLQQGRRRSRVRGRRAGRLVAQRRHAQVEQVGKSAVRRQRPPFFSGPRRFAYLRTQTVRSHECRIQIIVIVFRCLNHG